MEYSPPPLFKQGAPARVKVTVFALISIVLLMVDSRLQALDTVRKVTGTVLYPLQMAALMPRDALAGMGSYFSSLTALQKEVRDLKLAQVATAQTMQQAQLQMSENAQLRKLMGAREHVPVPSMMSEILYDARDSSTRKIVLDRGSKHNVILGLPFTSEVTLLTDKEQAIPVQVLRNGLRSVAYGRGQSGTLDLKFVAPNADIQVGDVLITSGLDGVYPAGLAVAKVTRVEQAGGGVFGGVVCQPLAGVDRHRQLLILMELPKLEPRPAPEPAKPLKKSEMTKIAPIREGAQPIVPAATVPATTTPATTPPAATTPAATRPPAAPATPARESAR